MTPPAGLRPMAVFPEDPRPARVFAVPAMLDAAVRLVLPAQSDIVL